MTLLSLDSNDSLSLSFREIIFGFPNPECLQTRHRSFALSQNMQLKMQTSF